MIWLPVESDSEIITQYAHELGLKDSHEFIDLYSFDPQIATEFGITIEECKAMILLFPLPGKETEMRDCKVDCEGFGPKFIKQTIENSCCLMALLHILLNDSELLKASDELLESVKDLESDWKPKVIENSTELKELHRSMATGGNSSVLDLAADVPFHFVSLIPFKGSIWLMDGRQAGPVEFKSSGSFLEGACKVAKEEFVQKSTDQTNFAALILI